MGHQRAQVTAPPARRGRIDDGQRRLVLCRRGVVTGGHPFGQRADHRPVHLGVRACRRPRVEPLQQPPGETGHHADGTGVQRGQRIIQRLDVSRRPVGAQRGGIQLGQQRGLRIGCGADRHRRARGAAPHAASVSASSTPASRRTNAALNRFPTPHPPPARRRGRRADPADWARCSRAPDRHRRPRRSLGRQPLSSSR